MFARASSGYGGVVEPKEPERHLRLERYNVPCQVGFMVNKEQGCPLFELEPSVQGLGGLLDVIKKVAAKPRSILQRRPWLAATRSNGSRSVPM